MIRKWLVIVLAAGAVLAAAGGAFHIYTVSAARKAAYEAGVSAMEQADYEQAIRRFSQCGEDYKDTASLTEQCARLKAGRDIEKTDEWDVTDTDALKASFSKLTDNCPYQELEEDLQKSFRLHLKNLFTRMLEADKQAEVKAFTKTLGDAYGEQKLWEAIACGAAGAILTEQKEYLELAGLISEIQEKELPKQEADAELFRKVCREGADEALRRYEENRKIEDAELAVKLYRFLKETDPDAEKQLQKTRREMRKNADSCLSEGRLDAAKKLYQALISLSDKAAEEKLKEVYYQEGIRCIETEDYLGAVRAFYRIPGYQDADEQLDGAKYRYCEAYADQPDETIYQYIRELTEKDYPGSTALANRIYSWHADISVLTPDEEDAQVFVVEAVLSGGKPGEAVAPEFVVQTQEGNAYNYACESYYYSGDTISVVVDQSNPDEWTAQEVAVEVYDEDQNLIGSYEGSLEDAE